MLLLKRLLQITKGFTLLEALISMAMIAIIIATIFIAFSVGIKTFTGEIGETDIAIDVGRAMDRMVTEFRGSRQIISAEGTSISFWFKDLNGNSTREENETVTYTWTGSVEGYLNRVIEADTILLAKGIKDFLLTYDNLSNIKVITIKLVIIKDSTISTFESSVQLRNI